GGKIVWYGDVPMFYQGHIDGTRTEWGSSGPLSILGFDAASGALDINQPVTITSDGSQWGLQNTWLSRRPTETATNVHVLAEDVYGDAAAWVKYFYDRGGFVRFFDQSGMPDVGDVQSLAEYIPENVIVFGDDEIDDIVAAFFYLWYRNPNTSGGWHHWGDDGYSPPDTWASHYLPNYPDSTWNPAIQLYDSKDIDVLRWQDRNLARTGLDIAIGSWWGINGFTNEAFGRAIRICKSVQWCIYYELDHPNLLDPTPSKIHDDIAYVIDTYGPTRNYAKIDGKWLVFVFYVRSSNDADRYRQAKAMLAADGYDVYFNADDYWPDAEDIPDPWDACHSYSPASRYTLTNLPASGDNSVSLSPGFWEHSRLPSLTRSLSGYTSAWNYIVANRSDSRFKVIETWNEWPEGTQIEPGQEIDNSTTPFTPTGYDYDYDFIDAVAPQANALLRWQSSGHRRDAPGLFEAEDMVWELGTSAVGDSEWRISDEGTRIGSSMFFTNSASEVWLITRARADQIGSEADWPNLTIYWDDTIVDQYVVNVLSHKNYQSILSATDGIHKLELTLADDPRGNKDVDLIVDCVDVYVADIGSDYDSDSIPDSTDNCPLVTNTNQDDEDVDGVGDECDDCPGTLYDVPVDRWGCPMTSADMDCDGDVDQEDFGIFQACLSGYNRPYAVGCKKADLNSDDDVDLDDFVQFQECMRGANQIPGC
ncbi:MAG: hypothetical protein JSV03_16790, partial [Planctomycetota bacterium]